jgi:hypothetical protein
MASLQEVANAARRIGQAAGEAQQRTAACAEALKTHAQRLAAANGGISKSVNSAVGQVNQAERKVGDSARLLATLQKTTEDFINDLMK